MAAQVLAGLAGAAGAAGGLLATIYKIIYGERAWKKLAPSEKEKMDYEDEINDENADLAYKRQREFQENYLSPAAQLSSLAAGYEGIGLNKMALVGANPGASSSSVPQAASPSAGGSPSLPSGIGDVFSSLLGYSNDKKRIDNDYKLRQEQLDIERGRLAMQERYYNLLGGYYSSKTTAQENENSIFGLRKEQVEKDVALKDGQLNQINQWIGESASRIYVNNMQASELLSRANLHDVQAAGQAIQNSIFEAQSKYSDRYYKALAKYQEATANLETFQSEKVRIYWDKVLKAYESELEGMILGTQQSREWINSEAWKRTCQGKMTDGERTQFWGNLVGGVVKTGLGVAGAVTGARIAGAARAAGSVASPLIDVPSNIIGSSNPNILGAPIKMYR